MLKYFNEIEDPKMVGLDKDLMNKLDKARNFANIPFIITSGVRTLYTNQQTGGVEDSSHLKGLACDISAETSRERFLIIWSALSVGIRRIGIGKTHIHLDIDEEKEQNLIFIEEH